MQVKVFKKMYLVILTIFVILMSSSCKNDDPFHAKESGDWIYTIDSCGEGNCAILGLTEVGKNKEVIVLPTEINDYKVNRYGKRKGYLFSPDIVFDNCKKLYFNSIEIADWVMIDSGNQELTVFIPNLQFLDYFGKKSNVTIRCMESISKFYEGDLQRSNYHYEAVNIEYYLDEDSCFFVDYVETGKIEVIPPKPFKDDYIFKGWYYNDIEWSFDNNLVDDYLNFNGILRLEAKWEKVIC